MEVKITI